MLRRHSDPIAYIAWSSDSQLLASSSSAASDRSPRFTDFGTHDPKAAMEKGGDPIRIWSRDGKLLHELRHHRAEVEVLSWSPSGAFLAAPFDADTVRIWDRDGKTVATLRPAGIRTFEVLSWSPDSTKIAVAGHSSNIWIYSSSGEMLARVAHSSDTDIVSSVAWSPDSRMFVSYGRGSYAVRGWWSSGAEGAVLSSGVPVRELWERRRTSRRRARTLEQHHPHVGRSGGR